MATIMQSQKWGELIPEDVLSLKRVEKVAALKKREELKQSYRKAAYPVGQQKTHATENYGPNVVSENRMEIKRALREERTRGARMWRESYEEKREVETRMNTFVAGVASFKKALAEANVHPVSIMRELPAMFLKSTGGQVMTKTIETQNGETDTRVAFFIETAKLIGFRIRTYVGPSRVIVVLLKPVPSKTKREQEVDSPLCNARVYEFKPAAA